MNLKISIIKSIKYILFIASLIVPFIAYFMPEIKQYLWDISLYSVFILMCIRPIGYLFPKLNLMMFLPLRKNLGIFSATIIVFYGLIHYISLGWIGFIQEYFSLSFWSFENNLFWAHLGELTGFILLITSNTFSMKLLKRNWKRIQRLSYVYFFSGSWYVFIQFNKIFGIIAIIIVFELVLLAYFKKRIIFDPTTGDMSWKW